jgi:hypothetical protein
MPRQSGGTLLGASLSGVWVRISLSCSGQDLI